MSAASLSGYERQASDWYVEPAEAVDALLDAERFRGLIYDPACGSGTIPKTCAARGFDVAGSDKVDRGYGDVLDFLASDFTICHPKNIITNPPFALAQEFIVRGLDVAGHKVAVLVRLAFLEGQKRKAFFKSAPLARVLVFSWRVSMPPGGLGIKAEGGKMAFCWLVFDHFHRGAPEVDWL